MVRSACVLSTVSAEPNAIVAEEEPVTRTVFLVIMLAAATLLLGCKDKPQVYACLHESGAECKEYYGLTQEFAEKMCFSSWKLSIGTCPTRNLIGRCKKALAGRSYTLDSFYGLPDRETVDRHRSYCSQRSDWKWLEPGQDPGIPLSLMPE